MKKIFPSLLMLAAGLIPLATSAQTTLASWNFECDYDTSEDANAKTITFTPKSGTAYNNSAVWFRDFAPVILPEECVGDKSGYAMTAKSDGRYWQITAGYQVNVFRIENADANAITDYSDASQHNIYYEIEFPTTGYKNISLEYSIAYGNNAAAPIETVVSTDGGKTWFDAGAKETSSAW